MSKLTALHINIIGFVVCVILSIALFLLLIKPANEKLQQTQADTESAKSAGGTDTEVKKAKTNYLASVQNANKTELAWNGNEKLYMPTLNFGKTQQPLDLYQYNAYVDPSGERFGLRDIPRLWGTWLEAWYKAQGPHIRFDSADDKNYVGIPGYSTDPNAISQLKFLQFPEPAKTWKIRVGSTSFDSAMLHLKRINSMRQHGMPVINAVTLEGHSPALTLNYEMALYVIPHTDPPPPDPIITPGGADPNKPAGGGGAFGGAAGGNGG